MIMLSLIVNLIAKLTNLIAKLTNLSNLNLIIIIMDPTFNLNLIIIIMDLTFNTGAYLAFTSPMELCSIT